MAGPDDEAHWSRHLLVAVAALAVVSVVVGLAVGAVALGAARVSGLDDSSRPTATARPSLFLPSGEPTEKLETFPDPSGGTSRSASAKPTPLLPRPREISLRVFPDQVGAGGQINLTGSYRRGEGATLQVQRLESGTWIDFPVDTTVTDRRFSTYILTSRTGLNRLRVQDAATGRVSNVVRVTVR